MKILLVDDHPVVRKGIRQILAEAHPQAEFGEVPDPREALDLIARTEWDVVVLDISLPGRGGIDTLKEIKTLRPTLPVLVLSMHPEDQFALRAFRAGAAGYVEKQSAAETLASAVAKVLSGGRYLSAAVAETLAETLSSPRGSDPGRPPHENLSDREFEVLRLIGIGRTVKGIAFELALSEKTVSTYRTRLLDKMKMSSTAEGIRYAVSNDLVK